MTFTTEAQALASKLQQDREYLEMFSADDQPELVAELKASIATSKRQLSNLGIFAA